MSKVEIRYFGSFATNWAAVYAYEILLVQLKIFSTNHMFLVLDAK
jgi:hypothetical protein